MSNCHIVRNHMSLLNFIYSKICLKRPLTKKTKIGFEDQLLLDAGQNYCRMLLESILQYFRPSLSYYLSSLHLFGLLLSGCSRQVLLYIFSTIVLNSCWLTIIVLFLCLHFQKQSFFNKVSKYISGIPTQWQTDWLQIKANILSGPIWSQTHSKVISK